MQTKPMIRKIDQVDAEVVPRTEGVTMQVLLGPSDDMPKFYTRMFTLQPGARIPKHVHDTIEHEQVIVEGTLELTVGDTTRVVNMGDVVYLPPDQPHAYRNIGSTPAKFLCMIPAGPYQTEFLD